MGGPIGSFQILGLLLWRTQATLDISNLILEHGRTRKLPHHGFHQLSTLGSDGFRTSLSING